MRQPSLRNAACELAARGWHVFPIRPGEKRPATKNGHLDATDDLIAVFRWWEREPLNNIGLSCHPSGLIVIDVDPRHGGDETFALAEKQLGRLPRTVEAETGGGGWHYYLAHPGGSLRGKLGDGLDLKDHGYVLAPPSLHPSGTRYEWSVDGHPDEVEVARVPDTWLDVLQVSSKSHSRVARGADPQGSPDPLRRIPAATYVTRITGRESNADGFWQCPFHRGGQERTPSLTCDGDLWVCYGCEPLAGKRAMGGNIIDFMGLILALPLPVRGADYLDVKERLRKLFG